MNLSKLVVFMLFSLVLTNVSAINNPMKSKTEELKFKYANFEDAEKNTNNYLKFTGKSTKLKIFTTEFSGYAKEFTVNYQRSDSAVSKIEISLVSNQLDTDMDSRNSKMFEKCLEVSTYPAITAKLSNPITLQDKETGEVVIELKIRDKVLMRNLKYNVTKNNENFDVHFTTDFSFVEAGIPDPSIAIAKVAENFVIEGTIQIK